MVNHLIINVNDSASWRTDPHNQSMLILNDAGNVRANLQIPNNFRVSDLAEKMHELTNATTWGENKGLTVKDYTNILQYFLFEFNK